MHWFERIIQVSCRFIFYQYHKVPLFRFLTGLIQFIRYFCWAHPFSHLLHHLANHLSTVFTQLLSSIDILYRTLVFLFWALAAQSQLICFETHYRPPEELVVGFGLLAGFFFSRVSKHISSTQTRSVPCLYLPISLFISDLCVLLKFAFPSDPIDFIILHLRVSQVLMFCNTYVLVKYVTADLTCRIVVVFVGYTYCRYISVQWVPFVHSCRI